jgi:exopolyphosphatase/guanosine-5'-triphosphate,3'-diphosphate pyrophosphatase
MSSPITLAAIDTGSNAIRVIISHAVSASELAALEAERVPVRLGHHTFTHGALDSRTIEDAVTAFARFRKLFDQHGVERYRAVATSALRNASNREILLDRLWREVGIELEVIDGEEEARLVRKAVLGSFKQRSEPQVIVDLGGGSLEITEKVREEWVTSSMRIGTVRLLETFGLSGSISEDEGRMIRRYVGSLLQSALPTEVLSSDINSAAACGGNAEALAGLFGGTDKHGMATLRLADLEEALPKLLRANVSERMNTYGVRKDRAEVMAVAALVFATVGKQLKLKRYIMPGVGIREGVLLDLAEATVGQLTPSKEHPAVAAARTFAARIGHNTTHGEQVRRIARTLFDQLHELHELPEDAGVTLELAALLHDIGEVVHRKGHHKHSEYLILNGRIPSLESPRREIVAAIARAHRRSMPAPQKHLIYAALDKDQQAQVRKLAAILRIADALDTDHRQRIIAISAELKSKKVALNVSVERNGTSTPPTILRKTEAFEAEFGRKVISTITEVSAQAKIHAAQTE